MSSPAFLPRSSEIAAPRPAGPAHVVSAVREASERTGVDFAYLMEKAATESGYRTDVRAATSSATGLYQFIDSTWLNTIAEHGGKHGLERYASAIQRRSGQPYVADPALKKEILDLRKDPRVSALMAAEFTRDNKEHLEDTVGGTVGPTEMYLAHFLGAGGASRFLQAMRQNPDRSACDVFPEAASSNRGVFFDRDSGKPTTLAQIYKRFAARFDGVCGDVVTGNGPAGSIGLGPRVGKTASTASPEGRASDAASLWRSSTAPASPTLGQPLSMFTILTLNALETPLDEERDQQQKQNQGTGAGRRVRDEMQPFRPFSGSQPGFAGANS